MSTLTMNGGATVPMKDMGVSDHDVDEDTLKDKLVMSEKIEPDKNKEEMNLAVPILTPMEGYVEDEISLRISDYSDDDMIESEQCSPENEDENSEECENFSTSNGVDVNTYEDDIDIDDPEQQDEEALLEPELTPTIASVKTLVEMPNSVDDIDIDELDASCNINTELDPHDENFDDNVLDENYENEAMDIDLLGEHVDIDITDHPLENEVEPANLMIENCISLEVSGDKEKSSDNADSSEIEQINIEASESIKRKDESEYEEDELLDEESTSEPSSKRFKMDNKIDECIEENATVAENINENSSEEIETAKEHEKVTQEDVVLKCLSLSGVDSDSEPKNEDDAFLEDDISNVVNTSDNADTTALEEETDELDITCQTGDEQDLKNKNEQDFVKSTGVDIPVKTRSELDNLGVCENENISADVEDLKELDAELEHCIPEEAESEDYNAHPETDLHDCEGEPEADIGDSEAEPAAVLEDCEAEPAAELEDCEAEPAAELEGCEAEPAAELEDCEAEPAAELEDCEAESAAELEDCEAELAAELEDCEAQPSVELDDCEAEPAAELEDCEAEPAAELEDCEAEPAAELEDCEAEPAAELEDCEAEPAAELEDCEAEAAAELDDCEAESEAILVPDIPLSEEPVKAQNNVQTSESINLQNDTMLNKDKEEDSLTDIDLDLVEQEDKEINFSDIVIEDEDAILLSDDEAEYEVSKKLKKIITKPTTETMDKASDTLKKNKSKLINDLTENEYRDKHDKNKNEVQLIEDDKSDDENKGASHKNVIKVVKSKPDEDSAMDVDKTDDVDKLQPDNLEDAKQTSGKRMNNITENGASFRKKLKLDNSSTKEEVKPVVISRSPQPTLTLPLTFLDTYKRSFNAFSRNDLEELLLVKVLETVNERSVAAQMREQIKTQEAAIDKMTVQNAQLKKQCKDLEYVHNHIKDQLDRKGKMEAPPKITRSVGLQVCIQVEQGSPRRKSASRPQSVAPVQVPARPSISNQRVLNSVPKTPSKVITSNPYPNVNARSPARPQQISTVSQQIPIRPRPPAKSPQKPPSAPTPNIIMRKPVEAQSQRSVIDLTDEEDRARPVSLSGPLRVLASQQLGTPSNRPPGPQSQRLAYLIPPNQQGGGPMFIASSGSNTTGQGARNIMFRTVAGQTIVQPGTMLGSPVRNNARGQQNLHTNITNILNRRPIMAVVRQHPAPLPHTPMQRSAPDWKRIPLQPSLKVSKADHGIVISWTMEPLSDDYEEIASYQIFAYQETGAAPSTNLWRKVGDVKAMPLPMACTLTQFHAGNRYHFAVRAVDVKGRMGLYSLPGNILLER